MFVFNCIIAAIWAILSTIIGVFLCAGESCNFD